MSCLFGKNTKKSKNAEPDKFFKTILEIPPYKTGCGIYTCQNKANFYIQACKHKMCAKCLNKSTKTFEIGHRVCVCPLCQKKEYSPWLEIEELIKNCKSINYCTTCFEEEAVFRTDCGHLLCSNCLAYLDSCKTTKDCTVFGCRHEFSSAEIKLAIRNAPEVLVWRYFEIANLLQCDKSCSNKAILKVTFCGHSYCLPCLRQKEYSNAHTCSNRDVILCSSLCEVEIPKSVIQNCFGLFRKESVMTAITVELSDRKCIRCKDEDLKMPRIKNRFCSFSHTYCIMCCKYMIADSWTEQPWLMSDVIEKQTACLQKLCKSITPVKCLDAMLGTLTGKNIQSEIFIRKAYFPRKCEVCRNEQAEIMFVRCSHGFCMECMEIRMHKTSSNGFLQCQIRACSNLIPMTVLSEFPKSTYPERKETDIISKSVGLVGPAKDTKEPAMLSKSQKDGGDANNCKINTEVLNEKGFCKSLQSSVEKKNEELLKVDLEVSIVQDGERLRFTASILSKENPKSVTWLKDGKDLGKAKSGKFERKDNYKEKSILYVNNLGEEDEGEYTALVTTSIGGHVKKSISFKLPEDPPKVELKMEKFLTSLNLRAEVVSKWPVKKWVWFKDGKIITERNKRFQEWTPNVRQKSLTITELEESDYGFYSILIITIGGRRESDLIQLKEDAPEISLELKIMKEEKKLRLYARGNPGEPTLILKWYHNNREIVFQNQTKYTETTCCNNVYILSVQDVNRADEGNFGVCVKNRSGKTTCKSEMFYMSEDLPTVSLFLSRKETELVELTAEIKSHWPIERFCWEKDEKVISIPSSKYSFDSFKLQIKRPNREDEGAYRLSVESVAGVGESKKLFVGNFFGIKESLPCDITGSKKHNHSENKKTDIYVDKPLESLLDGISRPYKTEVRCEICNKIATAVFQTCGHSFCLECLQRAAGSVDFPESTIKCPKYSCSIFATTETFREFLNRPHILHLEMPLYFKLSFGHCKVKKCSREGFINMSFCNHSLCITCLESCKSASICIGEDCTNTGIPPARYFDHLLSTIKDKRQIPFMFWGPDFAFENWKCSACNYPALYEIIRCCHKVCSKCMKEMKTGGQKPIAIGKCPVNGCNELYPIPDYRNPPCDRKTNASVQGSTLGQSEILKSSVVKPEKTVSHTVKKSRGLQNIAFSCYRNSILQILAETPGFYECLEGICDKESNSWTNPLAEILHRIRTWNTADVEMYSILNSFHYQFNNTNIGFREYQQEDTLSFLMTLLNGLNDHYEKSKKSVDGFKNALDIFKGKFEDKYFCENCKKEESFNQSDFLSLPLLKKSSLFESFSSLLEEETIDMFPCSRCESRTLKKQLQICSFPDVLVLQLNREGSVYWTRNDDKTDFKEFLKDAWNEELSQKVSLNEIKSYRLYGVVVHRGDEKGGHYICFVRRRDQSSWEECDDSVVTAASIKRVLRANAYLLFYEKCDSEV